MSQAKRALVTLMMLGDMLSEKMKKFSILPVKSYTPMSKIDTSESKQELKATFKPFEQFFNGGSSCKKPSKKSTKQ